MSKGKKRASRSGALSGRTGRTGVVQSKSVKTTKSRVAPPKVEKTPVIRQPALDPPSASTMRSVRVHLDESPPPNKAAIEPIIVDLFLSRAQKQYGKWFVFGWIGDPKDTRNSSYPFIIRHTGQIDFGSEWEDAARFGHTDLLDAEISVGRRVQFDLADWGEYSYRITRIQSFVELAEQMAPVRP
jgi:hypothetical protein